MKNDIVVKNIVKKNTNNTTITVKVTEEFKYRWDKWALDHNINKSKTLQAVLANIMDTYSD